MADRPQVKPGEWIKVGAEDCVVTEVSECGDGGCEVILDPDEPRRGKAVWNGDEWVLEIGESGYPEQQPPPGDYVQKLKRGRSR